MRLRQAVAVGGFVVMVALVVLVRYELAPTTWRSLLIAGIGFAGGAIVAGDLVGERCKQELLKCEAELAALKQPRR